MDKNLTVPMTWPHDMDYAKVIALICANAHLGGNNGGFGYNSYLEIGVERGGSMEIISPSFKRVVGVDIEDNRIFKTGEFYKMTSDEFFKQNKDTFDVIFIDACHLSEFVIRDFENALKILNKYGIIFFHDVDPDSPTVADRNKPYAKDAYKVIDYIYQNHPELNIITLPMTNAGLGICRRKADVRREQGVII